MSAQGADSTLNSRTKTIEIKVSLPRLPDTSRVTNKLPTVARTRKGKLTMVAVVVFASILFGAYTITSSSLPRGITGSRAASAAPRLVRGTPTYPTVLPAGKTIESLGGWTRISPPSRNPVFAYVDQLGPAQLGVSQQPLPEDFQRDTSEKMSELAQGFKANEKITAGSTTIYIGSSVQGPQSVIVTKKNLLILIKSSVHIENNQWAAYINSLR